MNWMWGIILGFVGFIIGKFWHPILVSVKVFQKELKSLNPPKDDRDTID